MHAAWRMFSRRHEGRRLWTRGPAPRPGAPPAAGAHACSAPILPHPSHNTPHPCAEHLVFLLNFFNTSAALLAPCALILHTRADLLPGFALTFATCILWLKLVSYAHVNWDYR